MCIEYKEDVIEEYDDYNNKPHPWVRYLARYLDTLIIETVVEFVIINLLGVQFKYFEFVILLMLAALLWTFIEPIIMCVFGTTLGKYLFNVSIKNNKNEKLSLKEAIKRSFLIYVYGLGFGLPFISLCTSIISYGRLMRDNITKWDEQEGYVVDYKKLNYFKVLIGIIIFTSMNRIK